jgi:hypothetical protein
VPGALAVTALNDRQLKDQRALGERPQHHQKQHAGRVEAHHLAAGVVDDHRPHQPLKRLADQREGRADNEQRRQMAAPEIE